MIDKVFLEEIGFKEKKLLYYPEGTEGLSYHDEFYVIYGKKINWYHKSVCCHSSDKLSEFFIKFIETIVDDQKMKLIHYLKNSNEYSFKERG